MKTDYAGIDYSLGKSNVNQKTGIHFGVISQNEVLQAWAESSEGKYTPSCPECGYTFKKANNPVKCPSCQYHPEDESDFFPEEADCFYYKSDGYIIHQSYDDTDLFVLKSPYFTYCQYCSPCAPGAGYITNHMNEGEGVKSYCLGHDWFWDSETKKAPYPVYSVKTGKLVTE